MIGIAAGLAQSGHVAFCYSIANFPTLRCLEQIRNDVCYHDYNVNIVSVGGGVAYGAQGYSHHALEDLAVMRALPNMVVAAPGDPLEVHSLTCALTSHSGPGFLRLNKAGEEVLHDAVPSLEVGQVLPMRDGDDVMRLSTGGMLGTTLQVAERLRQQGGAAGVTSVAISQAAGYGLCLRCRTTVSTVVYNRRACTHRWTRRSSGVLSRATVWKSRRAVAVQPAGGQHKRRVWRSTLFADTRRSRFR